MELIYHIFEALIPFDWIQYTFMKNALLAVLLIAPSYAILGTLIVNNRMAFFSDSLGHSILTGIAIGTILGLGNPVWGDVALWYLFLHHVLCNQDLCQNQY